MANKSLSPVGRLATVVALAAWITLSQGPALTNAYTSSTQIKLRQKFGGTMYLYPQQNYSSETGGRSSQQQQQQQSYDPRRQDFEDRSVKYYRTVRRMDTHHQSAKDVTLTESTSSTEIASSLSSLSSHHDAAKELEDEYRREFVTLAMQHYFALKKIKSGQLEHAERIYQKNIERTVKGRDDEGHCDHETLAASTLLLALLKQRMGDIKGTRSVFVRFFRIVDEDEVAECKCSAKVLQAFALFEMKRGHSFKSYFLAQRAVSLDQNLSPVLKWKQFRDIAAKRQMQQQQQSALAFVRP